jgi:hypothetical protein
MEFRLPHLFESFISQKAGGVLINQVFEPDAMVLPNTSANSN